MNNIEKLAELVHENWCQMAQSLMDTESLSDERVNRWKKQMVNFHDLPEEKKVKARLWAKEYLDVILGE